MFKLGTYRATVLLILRLGLALSFEVIRRYLIDGASSDTWSSGERLNLINTTLVPTRGSVKGFLRNLLCDVCHSWERCSCWQAKPPQWP